MFDTEGNNACTGPSQWLTVNEIFPSSKLIERYKSVCTFPCGKYHLKHIPFDEAMQDLSEITTGEFIAEAELLHSDLLPGKYEGSYIEHF